MPELPEVETVARSVDVRVRGDRILDVWLSSYPQSFKTPPEELARGLVGRSFLSVHRSGKHIVCELGPAEAEIARGCTGTKVIARRSSTVVAKHGARKEQIAAERGLWSNGSGLRPTNFAQSLQGLKPPPSSDESFSAASKARKSSPPIEAQIPAPEAQWIVHLGMTGRLLVADAADPVPPHTHARLSLSSGRELRFVDPRRFGRLDYKDLRQGAAFLISGREPLTIAPQAFAALFRNRCVSIKAALLNQSLLTGVGNIYADESLFRAGIRPRRMAGRLTRAELERLRAALRQVLRHAIRLGGSSVSDYVNAAGEPGFFQMEHCVYQRTGLPCRRCGAPIRRITIAGRGTHYCPRCQR